MALTLHLCTVLRATRKKAAAQIAAHGWVDRGNKFRLTSPHERFILTLHSLAIFFSEEIQRFDAQHLLITSRVFVTDNCIFIIFFKLRLINEKVAFADCARNLSTLHRN